MSAPGIFYLRVTEGDQHSNSVLYWRQVPLDFLPREDDLVHITATSDGDGVGHYVKRVYWSNDGTTKIEMIPFVIDPNEEVELAMQSFTERRYWSAWRTDVDGDLHELLRANHWQRYP